MRCVHKLLERAVSERMQGDVGRDMCCVPKLLERAVFERVRRNVERILHQLRWVQRWARADGLGIH